jgi:enoyl-CoA hydratase
MPSEFAGLRLEREGPVLELTLDRPELLNRIDQEVHDGLAAAFTEVARMDDVRAVVFASTGKVFSAGGDFDFILKGNADPAQRRHLVRDALHLLGSLLDVPVPVVVALHGDTVGLGTSLVLACDAVVAHRGVRLSDPHVAIGLVAGDGGCLVWPQTVGMLRAKRHLLTGDPLAAEEAFALGLVTDLVDTADEVLPAARALAERIAALPPIAVQGTKAALNAVLRLRFDEVMRLSATLEEGSLASADVVEAVHAFQEKRRPTFQGR